MDEEMDTSVDTSDVGTTDVDTSSATDYSEDAPSDIPEDVLEDIPEDDFSDSEEISDDIPDDIEENNAEETEDYSDDIPEEDLEEDIPKDDSSDMEVEADETEDELTEDIEEDTDVPSESDDYSDEVPDEVVEDDAETDDIDADDIQEELEDIPEDQSTDLDSGDDLSDDLQDDLPEDISPDASSDVSDEDDTVDSIPEDVGDNEQPADDQTDATEDTAADETAEAPTDTESDEQPADGLTDAIEDTTADRIEETPTVIESDDRPHDDQVNDDRDASVREGSLLHEYPDEKELHEYPDEESPQQYKKASPTIPDEITEGWAGIDPKSMPQNESAQFDEKLNELMESDIPSEEKRQILEEIKEDLQSQKDSMASEADDGQDDGAPVKVLKKDGGDTSISHHDYEKELADLDEGIKNWGLMQKDIARDLATDNERILKDDSLSEIEKQEQLALNEQKRQLLGQQYDAELSELQREREALAAKVDGNSGQKGEPSSPARTQSNQKMADGSEQSDDYDTQARSALRPTDAAFAPEDAQSPLSDLQNINRQQLANYSQAEVNDSLLFEKNNTMETNNRLCDIEMQNGLKLEDFSKSEFEKLQRDNPMAANKLMTEYVDRKTSAVDVNAFPVTENGRELKLTDTTYAITDEPCSVDSASMKDLSTGKEYTVYPNPLSRVSPYSIKQGNNSLGMEQDCGLASGSEAINGLYGKKIASEDYNTDLANKMENFEYEYKELRDDKGNVVRDSSGRPVLSDEIDWKNSGGTMEQDVKRMFDSYNVKSDAYSEGRTPDPETLAEALKSGDNVVAAVNSDLFWNPGDPRDNPAFFKQMDAKYAGLWKQGKCRADHFVNVYGACYDKSSGNLAGFMVKDTGSGRDTMVPLSHFRRAYSGDGSFQVLNRGCVIGRKGER